MSSAHPAPVTGNLHDVPNVWLHNTYRDQYVRDGGGDGSNDIWVVYVNTENKKVKLTEHIP